MTTDRRQDSRSKLIFTCLYTRREPLTKSTYMWHITVTYICDIYETYMWHICCIYVTYMLHSCGIYATYMSDVGIWDLWQLVSYIYVTYMLHKYICYIYVTHMLYECVSYVKCIFHVCDIYVTYMSAFIWYVYAAITDDKNSCKLQFIPNWQYQINSPFNTGMATLTTWD